MRQPFVAAPGCHHGEAAGARPIHQIANQRRLVAECQGVNDTGLLRFERQQRAAKGVGLHRDVHHMLAVRKRLQAVVDCGNRVAGAFDDDVNRRMRDQRAPVFTDVRAAVFDRSVQRRGLRALQIPTHTRQIGACAIGRQIGNTDQMHAGRARNLCQVHGAEFARADQADAERTALCLALLEFGKQAHAAAFWSSKGTVEVCSALPGMPSFQGRSTG